MRNTENLEIEQKAQSKTINNILRKILEIAKELIFAVLIVLLINNFIAIHARIPSGSMLPTIQIGDHFIVNRLAYVFKDIARGDIIVFDGFDGSKMIKRVIGLPGEIINIEDGKVYINDELLDESKYLSEDVETWASSRISFPLLIPEGEYFVMGDNRGNSFDSRYFNTIKESDIVGSGKLRIYPFDKIGIVE